MNQLQDFVKLNLYPYMYFHKCFTNIQISNKYKLGWGGVQGQVKGSS